MAQQAMNNRLKRALGSGVIQTSMQVIVPLSHESDAHAGQREVSVKQMIDKTLSIQSGIIDHMPCAVESRIPGACGRAFEAMWSQGRILSLPLELGEHKC